MAICRLMRPIKQVNTRRLITDEWCKRVIYGIRLLEVLSRVEQVETHLVLSDSAKLNIAMKQIAARKRFRLWQIRSTPTGILRRDCKRLV